MKRNVRLEEITDGKIYTINDMVRADTGGCQGCHVCCTGMGDSVSLDPYDVYRLTQGLECHFDELNQTKLSWHREENLLVPNLKVAGQDERCVCLDANGRCTIHAYRPSVCRLFPLGRYYHDDDFSYILQIHECVKTNRSKIKVKKWINNPDGKAYDDFILTWRQFKKNTQAYMEEVGDQKQIEAMNQWIVRTFFKTPYNKERSFYDQFYERLG